MITRLPLLGGALLLDANEDWCAVWLEVGGERTLLGGDAPAVIRERLRANLTQPREPAGMVDGKPVHWVLSLTEQHCTLYAQFGPEGRRLLIQGPQCEWIWQGALTEPDWRSWQTMLTDSSAAGR